jgi:hypothetical protein
LLSHRLALLTGSAARAAVARATDNQPVAELRGRVARRLVHSLRLDPFSEASHDHDGSLDLVVLSLEDWDDIWRRNQFLVDELLKLSPARRVLFVEPASDVLHAMRTRTVPPRPGLRQITDDGRLWALRPR